MSSAYFMSASLSGWLIILETNGRRRWGQHPRSPDSRSDPASWIGSSFSDVSCDAAGEGLAQYLGERVRLRDRRKVAPGCILAPGGDGVVPLGELSRWLGKRHSFTAEDRDRRRDGAR